jgi:hypothetical protein
VAAHFAARSSPERLRSGADRPSLARRGASPASASTSMIALRLRARLPDSARPKE